MSELNLPSRRVALATFLSLLSACGGGGSPSPTPSPVPPSPPSPPPAPDANTAISLLNLADGDTLDYQLPILSGVCSSSNREVLLECGAQNLRMPVEAGYFKGVLRLKPGLNSLRVSSGTQSMTLNLNYRPQSNPRKVQMVYVLAADHEGQFLSPPGLPNDLAAARQKLSLAALLLQSASSEMMRKASGQRRSFALLEDGQGEPVVKLLRLTQSRQVLLGKTDLEIYDLIATGLKAAGEWEGVKNLAIIGFSDYDGKTILASGARGGGNLAMFFSACLYTCPSRIDDLAACFLDDTKIDTQVLPDDSGGRGSRWANCATGLGAMLHEVGHTFDLPHTPDGIMGRGFDNFNRLFISREPGFGKPLTAAHEGGAFWHADSIPTLLASEWLKG